MIVGVVKVLIILLMSGIGFTRLLARDEQRFAVRKLLWLAPGIFLAGLTVPNFYALMLLLIALPSLVSRTRGEAAAVWMIMLLATPRLPFELSAGSIYLFDFSSLRCINLGFLIAVLIKPGSTPPKRGRMDLPFILFLALQIFIDLRSISATEIMRGVIMDGLSLLAPYYALSRSIATKADIKRVVLAMIFGAGVQSFMALFQVYEHWPTYEMINRHLGIARDLSQGMKMRAGLMRGNGPFSESTGFSWFLALAMTGLLLSKDLFRSAGYWGIAIVVLCGGLLATQSREGWIAAVMAVPLLDFYRGRVGRAMASVAALGLAGLLLIAVSRGSDRMSESLGMSGSSVSTVDYRQLLWRRGLEEIRQHPLLGRAPTAVVAALDDIRQGEGIVDFVNGYIYYGLVAGIIGVVTLIIMFLLMVGGAFAKRKSFLRDVDYLRAGGMAFAVATFTTITTFTSGFSTQSAIFLFFTTALCSAASGLALRDRTRARAHEPIAAS